MRTVAISLDGVLRKELDESAQDRGGALLFASLSDSFRVVVLGTGDQPRDEHFLMVNGMVNYVKIEPVRPEDGESIQAQQRAQLQRLRAEGFVFEFVVVPDPELATYLYSVGFPVLLYLHPAFSAESFRPDRQTGIRPWNELAAEVEFQRTKRAEMKKEAIR